MLTKIYLIFAALFCRPRNITTILEYENVNAEIKIKDLAKYYFQNVKLLLDYTGFTLMINIDKNEFSVKSRKNLITKKKGFQIT